MCAWEGVDDIVASRPLNAQPPGVWRPFLGGSAGGARCEAEPALDPLPNYSAPLAAQRSQLARLTCCVSFSFAAPVEPLKPARGLPSPPRGGRSSPAGRAAMNTIVFNKLGSPVLFEDNAKERERSSGRPYAGVLDVSPHPEVLIPDSPTIKDNLSLRHRRTG